MEDLLVLQGQTADDGVGGIVNDMRSKRLLIYVRCILRKLPNAIGLSVQ